MMAPKFERLRDLETVLSAAALELDHPIDRIEVCPHAIRVSAGPQTVDVHLVHGRSADPAGLGMPGSPSRSCIFSPVEERRGLFARIRIRFGL